MLMRTVTKSAFSTPVTNYTNSILHCKGLLRIDKVRAVLAQHCTSVL